ncbi:MAG: ABC transporter substrate-binding protein [Alphaproteobacteria bacterium]|nr:ABC transporter substrate-binding protein [Alphaproteobacteria bacterium]
MKKFLLSIMIATSLTACGEKTETPKENEKPVVKIGVVLPLSGSYAATGEAQKKAMLLALDDNVKESNKNKYAIIFEDNQMMPSKTAAVTNKLINIDKVDVLSSFFSAQGFVVAPIAERHKVLHFCNTWESENIKPLGAYTFLQGTSWEDLYQKYLKYFNDKEIKKVALFSINSGANYEFAKGLQNELNKNGIITAHEDYNLETRDFRILIQKYKSQGYEYFWSVGFPPVIDIILKQMHELGISNSNIFALGTEAGSEYDLYEGLKFYGMNSGSSEFKERLNAKQTYAASVSYDIMTLIINSFEAVAKDNKKPQIADVINHIKSKGSYDCVSGGCKVLPNNFIVNPAALRKFENGELVDIKE